ncbi:MAG TPA: TonB-dependent receptor, partial [Candidatus Kapabacteria bacterium]|nr:TonB-dependent receptor [Candidatus Kapabacteria bacterium]
DLDISPNVVYFTNTSGSFSNSAQIRLQGEIYSALTLAVAYRFNDVQFTTNGTLQQRALYSPHKSFFSISYAPSDWQFDATWTYRSGGRIPFVAAKHSLGSDESHDYATSFDGFSIVNMQAQYTFMGVELYAGVENLLDTMQHHPIIDPQNPYGENFDASLVWGPIMGRMFYSGIRWVIE